jgi:NADH:ubiquinone oxidoreductase subunit K
VNERDSGQGKADENSAANEKGANGLPRWLRSPRARRLINLIGCTAYLVGVSLYAKKTLRDFWIGASDSLDVVTKVLTELALIVFFVKHYGSEYRRNVASMLTALAVFLVDAGLAVMNFAERIKSGRLFRPKVNYLSRLSIRANDGLSLKLAVTSFALVAAAAGFYLVQARPDRTGQHPTVQDWPSRNSLVDAGPLPIFQPEGLNWRQDTEKNPNMIADGSPPREKTPSQRLNLRHKKGGGTIARSRTPVEMPNQNDERRLGFSSQPSICFSSGASSKSREKVLETCHWAYEFNPIRDKNFEAIYPDERYKSIEPLNDSR